VFQISVSFKQLVINLSKKDTMSTLVSTESSVSQKYTEIKRGAVSEFEPSYLSPEPLVGLVHN